MTGSQEEAISQEVLKKILWMKITVAQIPSDQNKNCDPSSGSRIQSLAYAKQLPTSSANKWIL